MTRTPVALLLATVLSLPPAAARALDCVDYSTNPRRIASVDVGGSIRAVASEGRFAYVGSSQAGETLHVVDLLDPAAPVVRGSVPLVAGPRAIAANLTHAFVLDADTSLVIVDATDPDAPFVAATLPGVGIWDVRRSGSLLYAAGKSGIRIVDVTDPAAPLLVGGAPERTPTVLALAGSRLLGCSAGFFYVYELTDPLHPALVGEREADPNCWPGDCESFSAVAGAGDHAWIALRRTWCTDELNCFCTSSSARLQTYDVSDPANPQLLASTAIPYSNSARFGLLHDRLHVFSGGADWIFDVANPAAPELIHGFPSVWAGSVVPVGASDLLVSGGSILEIHDVTNADRPHGIALAGDLQEQDIARDGDTVISLHTNTYSPCGVGCSELCVYVKEYDTVSDPSELLSQWAGCGCGYGYFNGYVREAEVAGDGLFLGVTGVSWGDPLYRIDRSDPEAPLGAPEPLPIPVDVEGLAGNGAYLYVAEGAAGVSVVDATLEPPALVAPAAGPETERLATSGSRAAGIGWGSGDQLTFHAIDLSVPTAPVFRGNVSWTSARTYWFPYWVTLEGDVAAVGHRTGLVRIVDVSDPMAPRVASQFTIPGYNGTQCFSGSLARSVLYVAAENRGVVAFDVSDPDAPVHRGSLSTNTARRVLATNDAVYVAVAGGIVAIPPDCAAAPTSTGPSVGPVPSVLALSVEPNPFRDDVHLRWAAPPGRPAAVHVFDVTGRRVRSLPPRAGASGPVEGVVSWDGRDADGHAVMPGVYFVRLQAGTEGVTRKLVRIR